MALDGATVASAVTTLVRLRAVLPRHAAPVTLHLANHALGLISLDAMETGRTWFLAIWRNPLGTALLYASFIVHPLNAFWVLYPDAPCGCPRGRQPSSCSA